MYLEVGINRDTGNDEGSIPLILAMNSYNWSLARSLLDAGAKINARGNTGYTVLHEQARLDGYKSIYFCSSYPKPFYSRFVRPNIFYQQASWIQ